MLIYFETTEASWTKLYRNNVWKVLYKDCPFCSDPAKNMAASAEHKCGLTLDPMGNMLMFIYFETTWPTGTKLGQNSPWMVPLKNYVRQVRQIKILKSCCTGKFRKMFSLTAGRLWCQLSNISSWDLLIVCCTFQKQEWRLKIQVTVKIKIFHNQNVQIYHIS